MGAHGPHGPLEGPTWASLEGCIEGDAKALRSSEFGCLSKTHIWELDPQGESSGGLLHVKDDIRATRVQETRKAEMGDGTHESKTWSPGWISGK